MVTTCKKGEYLPELRQADLNLATFSSLSVASFFTLTGLTSSLTPLRLTMSTYW
jgi:hypothetical protein